MSRIDKNDFVQAVYEVVRSIPYGRATSYGAIAKAIGYPNRSRMVGAVMGDNCSSQTALPAYRVVNSQGILSGKDAFATPTEMQEQLLSEGVVVENNKIKNWKTVFWDPDELGL